METRITEVADGVHQLTTVVPDAPVAFNQYLIAGEEPTLFHTGMRFLFPLVSQAVSRVPHAWEAGVLYDSTTKTLFCGDLFTRLGEYEPITAEDIVGPAVEAEDMAPGSLSLHPSSAATIRRLAELDVVTLALMHGPAYTGDCRRALLDLADDVDRRIVALSS